MPTTLNVTVDVVIPAFNEALSIDRVLADIPRAWVRDIIVVNNNSSDSTSEVARRSGATVLDEPRQGYGFACLKGLDHLRQNPPDVVVFLDADYSDYPEQLPLLVAPILSGEFDLVIGSRATGQREPGSMTPQQLFGNALATWLIRWLHGFRYTDLGPFRAISWKALETLQMQDQTYGWTVEMQLKALKKSLRITEVPVNYRCRIGHSKVSGTVKGTVLAGYKILKWVFLYR